jgi:hypothetical protein
MTSTSHANVNEAAALRQIIESRASMYATRGRLHSPACQQLEVAVRVDQRGNTKTIHVPIITLYDSGVQLVFVGHDRQQAMIE